MGSSDPRPPANLTLTDRIAPADPHRRPIAIAAIAAFWIIVGLVAGASDYAAARLAGSPASLRGALSGPLLAGLWWIPITLTAFALVQALPLRRTSWRLLLLVQLATASAVSFLLNLAFGTSLVLAGMMSADRLGTFAAVAGLRWLHINAAVYLTIVAIAYFLQSRRERTARPSAAAAERLEVTSRGTVTYLDVSAVDWIEGAGDYARVHAHGTDYLCSQRLKQLESRLECRRFARIHRSAIVNVDRVRQLRRLTHGDCEAVLESGTVLRVSRRRRQALEALLGQATGWEPRPGAAPAPR